MQVMPTQLRERAMEAEADLRVSAARAVLERRIADQKAQLTTAHDDVRRLRGEREVQPKPWLNPEALSSEAALNANDIRIEGCGEAGWAIVGRVCRGADRNGGA